MRSTAAGGVEDSDRQSPAGPAGDVEPIYDKDAVSFSGCRPDGRRRHRPQLLGGGPAPELGDRGDIMEP
jgi:hypothetical protein